MSASGVAAIDHTIQEINIWLKEITAQLHFEDRHHVYNDFARRVARTS